ncbi:HK97-gp10 family putative phage morphogenesis protein [Turicibacter sanguinis]|uniref:HK97-gp10 family putative phage morphogenesis protein n=1 Tax=Turicibacter sanguinis TaxID=154288 RepID=UPI00241DC24C|nr:HK97-gp10 family putative phage morphogenesis protein [Turicibacter sanguinis]
MSVQNVDKLLRKLKRMDIDVNDTLAPIMARQAKFVQGEAKDLCPVDQGELRDRIETTTRKSKYKVTALVHTNVEYAPYVEFGTGKVGETTPVANKYPGPLAYKQTKWRARIPDVGWRYVAGQPAQPFLYPALKNNEEKVRDYVANDLKQVIREARR